MYVALQLSSIFSRPQSTTTHKISPLQEIELPSQRERYITYENCFPYIRPIEDLKEHIYNGHISNEKIEDRHGS